VIAYGGDQACAAIRAKVAPHRLYEEHGHKLSFGIVDAGYVDRHGPAEVARRIAADCSDFDQHASLSPQVYLVHEQHPRSIAQHLAAAMRREAQGSPPGTIDTQDAAVLQHRRLVAEWRAAGSDHSEVWAPDSLEWTVVLDDTLMPLSGAGNRVARMVSVPDVMVWRHDGQPRIAGLVRWCDIKLHPELETS
jgi:hypothetical protein